MLCMTTPSDDIDDTEPVNLLGTIIITSGEQLNIRYLVLSYLRAVERFREQDTRAGGEQGQGHSESHASAALFEALNWADSIDQYLAMGPRDTMGTVRDQEWTAHLSLEQMQLAQAFQRVRNLVHHQWWKAIAVRLDQRSDHESVSRIWAEQTVAFDNHRKDNGADAAFAAQLQGRRLLETLDELAAIFWSKRTWIITRSDVLQPGHGVGSPLQFDPERDY